MYSLIIEMPCEVQVVCLTEKTNGIKVMKTIKLILATLIALGVVSCKKEDPRLSAGYFEITAQSVIEVENNYKNGKLEFALFSGESWKIGYLVSDYMVVRCKTSNCVYVVNGTLYTSTRTFYPPN